MENYDLLGTIGEGTYGIVMKARHKSTGQMCAIKQFKESDEDEQVRKTALREIRILKQLRHENIVSLLEVFRKGGKLYLVFEYVERTILEELEKHAQGLQPLDVKKIFFQLLKALQFIHSHNVIHRSVGGLRTAAHCRIDTMLTLLAALCMSLLAPLLSDIKPENLLLSKNGVLKLVSAYAASLEHALTHPVLPLTALCLLTLASWTVRLWFRTRIGSTRQQEHRLRRDTMVSVSWRAMRR